MNTGIKVEFDMKINNLAPNYASHPITLGELDADMSDPKSKWVWTFYVCGRDCDGQDGELNVYGNLIGGTPCWVAVDSPVLNLNRKYHIKWEYSKTIGGALWIDDQLMGKTDFKGDLNMSLSTNIILKGNIYKGGGRQHSVFDGDIENVTITNNGRIYENVTNGDQIVSNHENTEHLETKEEFDDNENVGEDHYIKDLFSKLEIPSKYVGIFNKEEITAKSLLLLKEEHLKELGVKLGPRLILMQYISNIQNKEYE